MRFAILLVVGCGAPFTPVGTCNPSGFARIEIEDTRPCECLERLVADAIDTAETTTGQRQAFEGLSVWLHASDGPLRRGSHVDGEFDPAADIIELERFGRALAHELKHRADVRAGASWQATSEHQGWSERGWLQPGEDFSRRWSPTSSSTFCY